MGKWKVGQRSASLLAGVDPRLDKLFRRALELSDLDMGVIQGRRTQAEQNALYEQGRTTPGPIVTWTRNSKHVQGLAIDIGVFVDGKLKWDEHLYDHVAQFFKQAATELQIPIVWGGTWKTKDRPHYELFV